MSAMLGEDVHEVDAFKYNCNSNLDGTPMPSHTTHVPAMSTNVSSQIPLTVCVVMIRHLQRVGV